METKLNELKILIESMETDQANTTPDNVGLANKLVDDIRENLIKGTALMCADIVMIIQEVEPQDQALRNLYYRLSKLQGAGYDKSKVDVYPYKFLKNAFKG